LSGLCAEKRWKKHEDNKEKSPTGCNRQGFEFCENRLRKSLMEINTNLTKTATDVEWLTITLRMVNDQAVTVGHVFKVRAKHTNKFTGAILRDGAVDLWRNTDQAACAEILMGLLSGWEHIYDADGESMEFNRDNLILMLTNYPQSGKQIADALLADLAKRGTTHGDL
jgi:hypothetical protein